ncbi:hypothetical protein OROHE_004579 [Orobanche hederae]
MGGWAIAVHGGAGVDPNLPKERQKKPNNSSLVALTLGSPLFNPPSPPLMSSSLSAIDHIINSAAKSNSCLLGRYLYPLFSEVQMVPLRVLVLNFLRAAEAIIKDSVEPLLEEYRPPGITSLKFSQLSLGTVAPKIEGKMALEIIQYLLSAQSSYAKFQNEAEITTVTPEKKKQPDPYYKLSFAEVFAKTRKRKLGCIYKSNPDVMQFRIDTIMCYNIGEICATISSDVGGDGTPMTEGPIS